VCKNTGKYKYHIMCYANDKDKRKKDTKKMQDAKTSQRAYWPTIDWQEATPDAMGMDHATLVRMQSHIQENIPGLHGLLIVRHGYIIFEEYYQGYHRNSYNSVSSATKSVISQLIGIALTQGLIQNIDQHMLDFFPDYAAVEKDPRKQAITLRHLLSLQTAFTREFPQDYETNPVHLALKRPMVANPGETFYYDSQGVDILSGIITRLTGKSAAAYAHATLFKTLGIWQDDSARFIWQRDPEGMHLWHEDALFDEKDGYPWKVNRQGDNPDGFGAHFTAREMAKLGYLYLNDGNWAGEQIIPAAFVQESTRQHSEGGWPVNLPYGLLWWLHKHNGYEAFFASGFGSKLIYVIPALDLVIVTVASTKKAQQDRGQEQAILNLIPQFIVPAARSE
jgi:CubicO group peptidase (beta-lactamase class C family)